MLLSTLQRTRQPHHRERSGPDVRGAQVEKPWPEPKPPTTPPPNAAPLRKRAGRAHPQGELEGQNFYEG